MPDKLPSMPFFVSDYLASTDVLLMSLAERGLYTHLLFRQWQDGRMGFNPKKLSILCACSEADFLKSWDGIKDKFNTDPEGRIYNRRLEDVKSEYARIREARSAAGSKGGSKTQANVKQTAKQTSSKNQPPVQSSPVQSSRVLPKPVSERSERPIAVPGSVDVSVDNPTPIDSCEGLCAKPAKTRRTAKSTDTWAAYSLAYHNRYGVPPTRNSRVNGQMARFITRVPLAEAPAIAQFYVGHNDAFYIRKSHPIGLLLSDAEKLRTEWQNGRNVTGARARQVERTATNFQNSEDAMEILRRIEHERTGKEDTLADAGTDG